MINEPSPSNVVITTADLAVSGYAAFGGPKGLAVAIVYHGGKQYVIMMNNAVQQGVVRPNPNPARGYMPGLASVFLIPNY